MSNELTNLECARSPFTPRVEASLGPAPHPAPHPAFPPRTNADLAIHPASVFERGTIPVRFLSDPAREVPIRTGAGTRGVKREA